MKKNVSLVVFAFLFSVFVLSHTSVKAESEKRNMSEGVCPTDNIVIKKQAKISFYPGFFGQTKRKTSFYGFTASKETISGSFGLGFGPFTVSVSKGASGSGSWGVAANAKKWSRVKLNEQGDIHQYTDRFCNITKKMPKVSKEWATVTYYAS